MQVAAGCLSLRYRLAGCAAGTKVARPINGGISFSLKVCFWSSSVIGWALPQNCWDFFVIICVMKRSGWRVMNTLVLAACSASRGCAWHMCENLVVFPLYCQEPTDLAWRFDSNLHSNFCTHNSITETLRAKSFSTRKVFPGLPLSSQSTCVICKNCESPLYYTWLLEIL